MPRAFLRCLCLIFPVIMLFSACSRPLSPEEILSCSQRILREGTEMELLISVSGEEAKARLSWSEQEQKLTFTAPETLEGLTYVQSAAGLELSKEGISQRLKTGQLIRSAAAEVILSAMGELSACDGQNLTMEEGFLRAKLASAELLLRTDGSLFAICWEGGEAKELS